MRDVLTGTNNQALFDYSDQTVYEHQGLRFRSATEVKIYDELVRRHLLVFPLPVAVLGNAGVYREPDFLVFSRNGNSGILEIHGEPFHPTKTTVKESARRRQFEDIGVNRCEVYDAAECYLSTQRIVSDFLARLKQG